MGLGEIAFLVQIRHDISNRSGTQILAGPARNCPGCNGFARFDIRLHDRMQDLEMPCDEERTVDSSQPRQHSLLHIFYGECSR